MQQNNRQNSHSILEQAEDSYITFLKQVKINILALTVMAISATPVVKTSQCHVANVVGRFTL
jgi:hypothetical protein